MENQINPEVPGNNKAPSLLERVSESIILKVFFIFFLTLIMLIPLEMIRDLIQERKGREINVSRELAMKWGKDQVISGPILAVPYPATIQSIESTSDGKSRTIESTTIEYAYLLPNEVNIQADVKPQPLKRGIYQAIVYNTHVQLQGNFTGFNLEKLDIDPAKLQWANAKIYFGIEDFKGLSKNPVLNWGGKPLELSKNNQENRLFTGNLSVDLPLDGPESVNQKFDLQLDLRGSKSLNFLPIAKQTKIEAKGDWANPSFTGNYLPDEREVSNTFKATWNIPAFERKLPAQWNGKSGPIYNFMGIELNAEDEPLMAYTGTEAAVQAAAAAGATSIEQANDLDMVQINFLPAVNSYQKTTRVAKYGILVVALSFVSLIFMELIKKQKVHLIQYILIGFAMVLFYGLLLAISEHLGFNWAYLVSALATMVLIASYVNSITKNRKSAGLFGLILSIFYLFIYVLLQLQDYSLIVGVVGIFIILAVLMRLSTKIDWYQFDRK